MEFKTAIFTKYLRTLYNVNLNKTNEVHKTLIEGIFRVFIDMDEDINKMRLEICLTTASDTWLDLWGEYFGIPRLDNETDEKYRIRMIAEIIEPKATLRALKRGAARWLWLNFDSGYTEDDIEVYEPWRDLIVTSTRGKVSYMGRLPDSVYWTHGIVDLAIPDASEMSEKLIIYLNTLKAAGVQLAWHRTMSWSVVHGYFESDSVQIYIERWFDIWFKREYEVNDGFRTLSPWYGKDDSYSTALSVNGKLSGKQLFALDINLFREFEPFRLMTRVTQLNPLIKLDYIAKLNSVDFTGLTLEQLDSTELQADRQIPNTEKYTGKSLGEEVYQYLEKDINEIEKNYYTETSLNEIDKTFNDISEMFEENSSGLEAFMKDWNNLNYFNKELNSSPLSNWISPVEILSEEDA